MITGLLAYAKLSMGRPRVLLTCFPATKKGGHLRSKLFLRGFSFIQTCFANMNAITATENNNVYSNEYTRVNNI